MRSGNLCVSLTPESLDDVFSADISGADCVEVRLDYLKNPQDSVHARWDRVPVPVIATCRGKKFGGLFEGSEEEELQILNAAARNGARFVDLDYRIARPVGQAEVIASYHNFDETPADLSAILDRAMSTEARMVKVATQVNRWSDNRRLLDLLAAAKPKPMIVTGMGELGQIVRIVGCARGSFLTYAASRRQSAPGQLSAGEMLSTYRFRSVAKSTRLLGIVGMPVGHSQSPVLHNRAFDHEKLDFVYAKLPVPDLKDFMDNARAVGLAGFSVTIPHKVAVMPCMTTLTPEAAEAGAVNTVCDNSGSWTGDNTDVHGVREAFRSINFDPAGKTVVILGKGGAAKAAAVAARNAASVRMLSRAEIPAAGRIACDILINATPVGMYPDMEASPVDGPISAPIVFDMVYNPVMTTLLRNARSQGRTIITGQAMFFAQAARQFEIWTGRPAPSEVYRMEMTTS